MQKPITGTWFEFWHHNIPEGKYWNPICRHFSAEQWEAKVDELASVGMKYIVLMATALGYEEYAESYFDTDIFPFAEMDCKDPMSALLNAADRNGMKVFVSCGFYGVAGGNDPFNGDVRFFAGNGQRRQQTQHVFSRSQSDKITFKTK